MKSKRKSKETQAKGNKKRKRENVLKNSSASFLITPPPGSEPILEYKIIDGSVKKTCINLDKEITNKLLRKAMGLPSGIQKPLR
jgi:hypothetical protein